jgi:tRNA threonylcarbamoyladenosine biosynthesis protein TsaB
VPDPITLAAHTPARPRPRVEGRPRLLGLDTTAQRLVVALADGDATVGVDEEGGARASSRVLPAVDALLRGAGITLRDLDATAFARGPGAFTGLRTAASVTQGLAFGLGLPVLPIDSLLVVAEDARLQLGSIAAGTSIGVAADARMDQIYAATYRWGGDGWVIVDTAALVAPEALVANWSTQPPDLVTGSAFDMLAGRLGALEARRRVSLPRVMPHALASLARMAWRDGAVVAAGKAQPLYVRDKVAFTTIEREAAKAAATTPVTTPVTTPLTTGGGTATSGVDAARASAALRDAR